LPSAAAFVIREAMSEVPGKEEFTSKEWRVIEAHHPDTEKLASRFVKAAWQRRGLVAWVERPGVIRAGDEVRVMLPRPVTYVLPAEPAHKKHG
jgi:hypothetical protein